MIQNLHEHVPGVADTDSVAVVSGDYQYCHYLMDGTDDRGWGCGYRTLQTILSWIINNTSDNNYKLSIPSIQRIQEILVQVRFTT